MTQLNAFLWTVLCESPLILFLAWRQFCTNQQRLWVLFAAVTAQCVTHPIAWYLSTLLYEQYYFYWIALIEIGVFLIEAGWYCYLLKIKLKQALLWSFVANFCSTLLGFMLQ